jgi:hypothetical protein
MWVALMIVMLCATQGLLCCRGEDEKLEEHSGRSQATMKTMMIQVKGSGLSTQGEQQQGLNLYSILVLTGSG